MKDVLKEERAQLIRHWGRIDARRLEQSMERVLDQSRLGQVKNINDSIRKFHNILGYKAMGDAEGGGLCVGCIYRTLDFIRVSPSKRTGYKPERHKPESIHVEHTIPVTAIASHLMTLKSGWTRGVFFCELFDSSVATAVQRVQGGVFPDGIVRRGFARKTNAFSDRKPFNRYDLVPTNETIYNVLTGQPVDVNNYTLEDHIRTVEKLVDECANPPLSSFLRSISR